MNLIDTIKFSADFMSPGAALAPKVKHHAVVSKHIRGKLKGRTRIGLGNHRHRSGHVHADASPSDLASHHLWQEPSATDVTQIAFRQKRQLEKQMRRNMDPFEAKAEMAIRKKPCGCQH